MDEKELRKAFNWCQRYIKEKNIQKLKELVEENHELLNYEMKLDGTLLHVAAEDGTPEMLKFLVSKGMDVNKIVWEYSPIDLAVLKGRIENVITLLELGAKLNTEQSVLNPLFTAIHKGNHEIARILIDEGIDLPDT